MLLISFTLLLTVQRAAGLEQPEAGALRRERRGAMGPCKRAPGTVGARDKGMMAHVQTGRARDPQRGLTEPVAVRWMLTAVALVFLSSFWRCLCRRVYGGVPTRMDGVH